MDHFQDEEDSERYNLRARKRLHETPPGAHSSLQRPAQDRSSQQYPDMSSPGSPRNSSPARRHDRGVRPKSARPGLRTPLTAPEPGWLSPEELQQRELSEDLLSEDEDPPLSRTTSERSAPEDGVRQRLNRTDRRTPPPSPRRTPERWTQGTPEAHCQQQASAQASKKSDTTLPPWAVLLLVLMCGGVAYFGVGWYRGHIAPPPLVGFDGAPPLKASVHRWKEAITTLAGQFPYQRPRLWKVLRAAVNRMLLETRQPAVVLLMAGEEQRADVGCVLNAAADAVLNATGSAGRALRVDGAALAALDEQEAKGRLGAQLDRLRGGDGVAVFMVEEAQQLQPRTAMLLHGFCDNDNAPRKKAVFLLSVVTKRAPPGDGDLELAVERALWQAWGGVLGEDIFHALLGRIAGNVAAVAGEGSGLRCRRTGV